MSRNSSLSPHDWLDNDDGDSDVRYGWSVGWLVGWLVACLLGWLVDRMNVIVKTIANIEKFI